MMVRLIEEFGEFVREVNYCYGEKLKKVFEDDKSMEEEMGDVLFVLVCLVNFFDIFLEEVYDWVMYKFNIRDKDCWIRKEEGKQRRLRC